MPVARRYGNRQVNLAPLPAARLSAAETAMSQGAAVAQARAQKYSALAQLGGVGASVGQRVYDQLTEHADQMAVLDATNRYAEAKTNRLYNPDSGDFVTKKGEDAFDLPKELDDWHTQTVSTIETDLHTPRQRELFANFAAGEHVKLGLEAYRYTDGQRQQYEADETRSGITNALGDAVTNALDPAAVARSLGRAETIIRNFAPRTGAGPEQVQAQVAAAWSSGIGGVIDRLLTLDRPEQAKTWLEEARDSGHLTGDALAKLEQAVDLGTLTKQAQTESDKIVAAGGTLTDQREKARAIDDPKLRDQVMQRIEHEEVVRDHAQRQADEQLVAQAYQLVDEAGGNLQALPPQIRGALPGTALPALENFAEARARGVPVETDMPTYYGLMRQAGDDPQAFATRNLLELKGKLGEAEFKQLTSLQLSLRNRDTAAADKQLAQFSTQSQVLEDTVSLYGIDLKAAEKDPTSAVGQQVLQIRNLVRTRVNTLEQSSGKKATNADVQAITNDVLSKQVTLRTPWRDLILAGTSVLGYPFNIEGYRGVTRAAAETMNEWLPVPTKPLTAMTVDDIGVGERATLEDALQRAGRPTTDPSVLNFAIETRARLGDHLSVGRLLPAERQQLEAALRAKNQPVNDTTVLSLYLRTLAAQLGGR